jgi:hypothetical protein
VGAARARDAMRQNLDVLVLGTGVMRSERPKWRARRGTFRRDQSLEGAGIRNDLIELRAESCEISIKQSDIGTITHIPCNH